MNDVAYNLPDDSYPFTVELWKPGAFTDEPATWHQTVDGPGVLKVPGYGPGTWCRLSWPDGLEVWQSPPGVLDDTPPPRRGTPT